MAENPIDIYSKTNEDNVNENGNWNADTTAIFRKILGSGISFDEESNTTTVSVVLYSDQPEYSPMTVLSVKSF